MKITKDIKLENTKRCDGCPVLKYTILYETRCGFEYRVEEKYDGNIKKRYVKRPELCIKENGL